MLLEYEAKSLAPTKISDRLLQTRPKAIVANLLYEIVNTRHVTPRLPVPRRGGCKRRVLSPRSTQLVTGRFRCA